MKPIRPNPKSFERSSATCGIERTLLALPLLHDLNAVSLPHSSSPPYVDRLHHRCGLVMNNDVSPASFDFSESLVLPSHNHSSQCAASRAQIETQLGTLNT
jgi:hypothetical protein